ncbi:MAG: PilT/PilU family type 4a pilus ATPase [Phycisphaerales bacterium]|nr:PilT/PilU family type 4a pilus ATPase [Phycisphaerales bacterium]
MRKTEYQTRTRHGHNGNGNGCGDYAVLCRPPKPKLEAQNIIDFAKTKGATDIHIVAGVPILFRIDGELIPVTRGVLAASMVKRLSYSLLNDEQITCFEDKLDFDFMLPQADRTRCRVNVSFVDGQVGTVIRLLPNKPLSLKSISLPPVVNKLPKARKGLILITGSTSQGKTTTLASMIDSINRQQRKNIITIEDPIEYIHTYRNSSIRQRQVGRDTESFAQGLRAALRQDPDVIAIGEMRDFETIKIALTAAATGVLVISTMHIISIDKIIERVLTYTPDGSEGQIRTLLAEALLGVIHQELLPTVDGRKRIASEILVATDAVRNLIRNRGTVYLRSIIATGQRYGMQSMKTSLDKLREEGEITDSLYRVVLENYR